MFSCCWAGKSSKKPPTAAGTSTNRSTPLPASTVPVVSSTLSSLTDNYAANQDPVGFLQADFAGKRAILDDILLDDIKLGFFTVFCESQYSMENIKFIIATDHYRDIFSVYTGSAVQWEPSVVLDRMSAKERPVHDIDDARIRMVESAIKDISDNFLSPSAQYEICVESRILARTKQRQLQFRSYGPGVFDEARLEPMDTLLKDIMPRFVVSEVYSNMIYFLNGCSLKRTASALKVPPPVADAATNSYVHALPSMASQDAESSYTNGSVSNHSISNRLHSAKSVKMLTLAPVDSLKTYFVHPLMYSYMLRYLSRVYASENLLCVRVVDMLRMQFDDASACLSPDYMKGLLSTERYAKLAIGTTEEDVSSLMFPSAGAFKAVGSARVVPTGSSLGVGTLYKALAVQRAWDIYNYFVAPGSPLEIGLSSSELREVRRNMATPTREMFDDVRKEAFKVLRQQFTMFRKSPEYQELINSLKEHSSAAFLRRSSVLSPPSSSFANISNQGDQDKSLQSRRDSLDIRFRRNSNHKLPAISVNNATVPSMNSYKSMKEAVEEETHGDGEEMHSHTEPEKSITFAGTPSHKCFISFF